MSSKNRSSPPAVLSRLVVVLTGAALLVGVTPLSATQRFRRADSNADGILDIADAIHSLGFLFRGSPDRIPCEDTADANDDGDVDVSDPVITLLHLFRGAPAPPPPFGGAPSDCGEDLTADALGCESFSPCPPLPLGAPTLVAPRSPTRDPSVELRGTAGPGLQVTITGGVSPVPILTSSGPDGAFAAEVELTPRR